MVVQLLPSRFVSFPTLTNTTCNVWQKLHFGKLEGWRTIILIMSATIKQSCKNSKPCLFSFPLIIICTILERYAIIQTAIKQTCVMALFCIKFFDVRACKNWWKGWKGKASFSCLLYSPGAGPRWRSSEFPSNRVWLMTNTLWRVVKTTWLTTN